MAWQSHNLPTLNYLKGKGGKMNTAEKVLQALDVAYSTGQNVIRIPRSMITEGLIQSLNLTQTNSQFTGRVAQFKVVSVPDVQIGFTEWVQQ